MSLNHFRHLLLPTHWLLVLALGGCEATDHAATESGLFETPYIVQVELIDSEANPLARVVEVTLSEPGTAELEFWMDPEHVLQKASEQMSETHRLPLIGLHADAVNYLVVNATFEDGTGDSSDLIEIPTEPLSFQVPKFNILVETANDGIITTFGLAEARGAAIPASALGINRVGEVVWVGRQGRKTSGWNFYETTPDGLFIEFPASGDEDGFKVYDILSVTSDVMDKWLSPYALHHDGAVLPNGNLMVMHNQRRFVEVPDHGEVNLRGDALAEVTPQGEVLWEWNAFDHLDTTRFPVGESQIASGDWTHGNSLDYLEATDELIVSFRNQNQIMTISRDSREITRIFGENGDYALIGGAWFKGQHHASLSENGILTVFDNHYPSQSSLKSRVVQYKVNEQNKTIDEIWSFDLGHSYRTAGEATVLENGNLRVSAGGANRSVGAPIQLLEFNQNRELIWHIELPSEVIPMVFRSSQLSAGLPTPL